MIVLVDGDSAVLVEPADADVESVEAIDQTRRFSRVVSDSGEALEAGVGPGMDRVATATAAELTGLCQRTLEMTVEYAKEREQFGRPIGAYQAVSHGCVQMLLETENSRATTYFAGYAADSEPDALPLAAASAKAYASDAGWHVTATALQLHGGIGFTWEHDLHFFLKRAKTDGHLYGTAAEHRERVADLFVREAVPV